VVEVVLRDERIRIFCGFLALGGFSTPAGQGIVRTLKSRWDGRTKKFESRTEEMIETIGMLDETS